MKHGDECELVFSGQHRIAPYDIDCIVGVVYGLDGGIIREGPRSPLFTGQRPTETVTEKRKCGGPRIASLFACMMVLVCY